MRYDNLSSFEKHLEETEPSRFLPLYLILGKESFETQGAVKQLLKFLLPGHESGNKALKIVEGSQINENELAQSLYSAGSFFSKTEVLWIQQADSLKKSVQAKLEKYMSNPSPSLHLVLSAQNWLKNTTFYKAVDAAGAILEFRELKSWEKEKQLIDWVGRQAAAARKLMPYPVCQHFIKTIGLDQALVAQELEKLFCYCIEKKEIGMKDIQAISSCLNVDSIWSLGESIFKRDCAAALQSAHGILNNGQPLMPLLRQLRSVLQTDFQVCLLLHQGKQAPDITAAFPYMKGKILDQHINQARNYGLKGFKNGLMAIDQAEMKIKNSAIDDAIILELLILNLTGPA